MNKKIVLGQDVLGGKEVTMDLIHHRTNGHVLILGESGSGKTYLTQILLEGIVENEINAFVLDLSGSLSLAQAERDFLVETSGKMKYRNVARDGTGIDVFQKIRIDEETKENEVELSQRLSDILSCYFGRGDNQKAILYKYIKVMASKANESKKYLSLGVLKELLARADEDSAETMARKITPLTDGNYFSSTLQENVSAEYLLTIWQLQSLSMTIKQIISELILWQLWGRAVGKENRDQPIYILIDECQNMRLTLNSPIYKILCEGRKYGINLILSTQFYKGKFQPEVEMAVSQIGNQIFFKPPDREVKMIAGMITDSDRKKIENNLRNLKRGEAIVSGGFSIGMAGNDFIKRPKKIKVRQLRSHDIYNKC